MTYKRILVPIYFSDLSIEALDYAVEFARAHHSEVWIVHMIEPIMHTRFIADVSSILEQQRADAAEKLAAAEKHARHRLPRVNSEIHFGVAHEVIRKSRTRLARI